MEPLEALDKLRSGTHTVWRLPAAYEMGQALGLFPDEVPVHDFKDEIATQTGNPKGYFHAEGETDHRGVDTNSLLIAAIRKHHLYDAGQVFGGRGYIARARADVLSVFFNPGDSDLCPFCNEGKLRIMDDSNDERGTFACGNCMREISYGEGV